ncbi:hypothetical protein ENHY17A_250002 [Moraxellaceae bacterium 17A]|nr:hypothetical protein ENHY17A_250002 [Moraxellaceae bacterium 17A]
MENAIGVGRMLTFEVVTVAIIFGFIDCHLHVHLNLLNGH